MNRHDGCRGCINEFDFEENNKNCTKCKYNYRDRYIKREDFKQEYVVEEILIKLEH